MSSDFEFDTYDKSQACQVPVTESVLTATTTTDQQHGKRERSRLSAKKHRKKLLDERKRLDEELSSLEAYISAKTAENTTLRQELEQLKFQVELILPGITNTQRMVEPQNQTMATRTNF